MQNKPCKSLVSFHNKNPEDIRLNSNLPQHDEDYIWQTKRQHHTKQEKTESISSKLGSREGCLLSLFLFDTAQEILATASRQEKTKEIPTGREEVKWLVCRSYDPI